MAQVMETKRPRPLIFQSFLSWDSKLSPTKQILILTLVPKLTKVRGQEFEFCLHAKMNFGIFQKDRVRKVVGVFFWVLIIYKHCACYEIPLWSEAPKLIVIIWFWKLVSDWDTSKKITNKAWKILANGGDTLSVVEFG